MNLAHLQYELAMSAGSSLDLTEMFRAVVRVLVRGLDAAAVAAYQEAADDDLNLVFSTPRTAHLPPRSQANLDAPTAGRSEDGPGQILAYRWAPGPAGLIHHYITIPDFGYLCLARGHQRFEPSLLAALIPIMERIGQSAQACLSHASLQRSRARFANLVAKLPEVIFEGEFTHEGSILFHYVSPPAADILGVSATQLLDTPQRFIEAILPADREPFTQAIKHALNTDSTVDQLIRWTRGEGQFRWFRVVAQQDRSGYWTGLVQDVDARQRLVDQELASSQIRKAAILEAAADAIVVTDQQGIITDWNGGAQTLLGYEPPEILGQPFTAIIAPLEDAIDQPGDLSQGPQMISTVFDEQREVAAKPKEGEAIPVEVVMSKLEQSGTIFFVGILRDIRPRLQAKKERQQHQQQERHLSTMVNELGQAAVSASPTAFRRRLMTTVGQTLDAAGVSLWTIDDGGTAICQARWCATQEVVATTNPRRQQMPLPYLQRLRNQPYLISNQLGPQAMTAWPLDESTEGDGSPSIIDTALRDINGQPTGFIRIEDLTPRQWSSPQLEFCQQVATLVSRVEARDQAQKILADQRQRQDAVLANTSAIIYSAVLPSFDVDYVSGSSKEVLGFEPEEMMTPGFWPDAIHPDDLERITAGLEQLMIHGEHTHEYRHRDAAGGYRWLRDQVRLIYDDHTGQPTRAVGSSFDITDRKLQEAKINALLTIQNRVSAASTAFLDRTIPVDQAIDDSLQTIGAYANADRCYILRFGDTRATKTHQWCAPHIAGGFPNIIGDIASPELAFLIDPIQQRSYVAIKSIEELLQQGHRAAHQLLSEHGIERLIAAPLVCQGSLNGVLALDNPRLQTLKLKDLSPMLKILSDTIVAGEERMTYERQLELLNTNLEGRVRQRTADLQASEKRFQAIFAEAPQAMLLIDSDQRVIQSNETAKRLFHYGDGEVPFPPFDQLITPTQRITPTNGHGNDEASLTEQGLTSLPQQLGDAGEHLCHRLDGSLFYGELQLQPLTLREGETYTLAAVNDITTRRQAQQSLMESKLELSRLNRLMQSIIESPRDLVVFSLDRDYRYIALTMAHRQVMKFLWGRDVQVGDNMLDIIDHDQDRAKAKANFDRCLKGEYFMLREQYGSGSARTYYDIRYSPLVDADGDILGCTVFSLDVSERIKAEEKERRERSYRELLGRLSTKAIGMRDVDTFQRHLLRDVGETLQVSRVALFSAVHNSPDIYCDAQWHANDVAPPEQEQLDKNYQLDEPFQWPRQALETLRKGDCFWTTDDDGQQLRSVLYTPLFIGRQFQGFIAVEDHEASRQWNVKERELMRGAARILLGVWADNKLRQSEQRFHGVLKNVANVAVIGYGDKGVVRYWNDAARRLYGFSSQEATGQYLGDLIYPPQTLRSLQKFLGSLTDTSLDELNMLARNLVLRHQDGSVVHVLSSTTVVKIPSQGQEFFQIDVDLREIKEAEEKLIASLHEKETLLKEIHHRVKNNLQMISGLLTLQSAKAQQEETKALLQESVSRVRSMALIHQQIYGVDSLDRVEFNTYMRALARTLQSTLAPGATLDIQGQEIYLSVEEAIPLGLVLNELLTNAFKYGTGPHPNHQSAPDDCTPAQVKLHLAMIDDQLTLTITDSGPGLPEGFDFEQSPTLGLRLVRSLLVQLRGQIHYTYEHGASFQITFAHR